MGEKTLPHPHTPIPPHSMTTSSQRSTSRTYARLSNFVYGVRSTGRIQSDPRDEIKRLIDSPRLIQARFARWFPAFRSTAIELRHNKYLSTQAAFYRFAVG